MPGGGAATAGPDFSVPVVDGGYRWWYIDARSDDGQHALTLIAFIGSVFSPYYAHQRRKGSAPAANHCALNAVFYGPGGGKRWSMTERGAMDLARDRNHLGIGPSSLDWRNGGLDVDINERCVPLPYKLRGRVRVTPTHLHNEHYPLDAEGQHCWQPLAAVARVEVELEQPGLRWQGNAYFDSNWGVAPLESGFRDWDWSRAHLSDGSCAILYDTRCRDGHERSLALRLPADGPAQTLASPPRAKLPRTGIWRITRETRSTGGEAQVLRTLEDTPFYSRSLVRGTLLGETVDAMHESLNLDRFASPWVQVLLPFRMPRRPLPPRV